ncbi:hypothetical protein AW736_14820 [Termitidicoccus mucosus]|uniref:YfhO family protein n=1 Tax=Termitidicoccus mucosus TaxID=1184151 RepID=A0A178IH56_9BACT|nr:hypothetical protein AW736_14820 [Opitutaceae bacterium TSB47]
MKNFSSICFSSPVFWLFALAVVFLGDLLFFGKIFLSRDMLSGFFQTAVFETQGLLNGDTPFWNPYWGGGKPLIADTTSQAFYPPNILFLFFQPALAMNLFWLLHFFIGGLGMWFFCRQINVAAAAAFIAGVSFMFGTWLVAQLEFPFNGAAGVWVPWIFGMLARFHARLAADGGYPPGEIWRQRRLVGALALLFAVQFFANFPEMIIYPGVGYALYIIAAVISERKWRTGVTLLLFVGVSGLVGLLMTLPQIVSMWELLPYSERAGTFDSRFDMASMQPAHLLGVIFPFLGGFPGWPDKHWESGLFEYWIGAFYLGALPVVSAPFAFLDLSGRRKIWAWVATAMILIGVLLSLGAHTPLYGWWHAHVPLMNRFRFPAKFLVLVVLGLLVLAALGIDTLLRRPSVTDKKNKTLTMGLGVVVMVGGLFAAALWMKPDFAVDLLGNAQAKIPEETLARAARLGLVAWGFLALAFAWTLAARKSRFPTSRLAVAGALLAFANLLVVSRQLHPAAAGGAIVAPMPVLREHLADVHYRAFSPYSAVQQYLYADPRPEIYLWARQAGSGGMWLADGVHQQYQAGTKFLKWHHLNSVIYGQNAAAANCALDWFGVKWLVQGAPWQNVLWGNASRDLRVIERATALPRFKLFDTVAVAATDSEVLSKLAAGQASPGMPLAEPACWYGAKEMRGSVPSPDAAVSGATIGRLEIELIKNSRVILRTEAAGARLLWFGDTWYPGWRAFIDGQETPIHRVNYMFMGIGVPAGQHRIEFKFVPRHFVLCTIISLSILTLALTMIAMGKTRLASARG